MDIHEVSQEGEIAEIFRTAEMMRQRAKLRKGQLVHRHPPPVSIVATCVAKARATVSTPLKHHIVTTQLPPPYLPSDRLIEELQPMTIRQMRLEEHHRGAKVILRILTPPSRINAIMGAVEDLEGTAVLLQLYHQPLEETVPAAEILNTGRVFILKEPYFKCSTDGSYSLRVDHLSDILWLELFDTRIPDKWRKTIPEMSSEALRIQGNKAVERKDWAGALRLYSDACRYAETPKESQLAFVNRSLVNLKLGRPEQAFRDATETNEQIPPTEKSMYREIRALYEVRSFDRCTELLKQFTERYPDNKEAKAEMNRAMARLGEQTSGTFSFASMYNQAAKSLSLVDCATFSSLVEVRDSPGRGRGLFTVKSVKAGDLLLCEKAFAYKYSATGSDNYSILMDLEAKRAFAGGQAIILTQMIQNLYHNPDFSRPFLQLHHGDYKTVSRARADGNPVVDSFLAAHIMSLNVFGAPRSSKDSLSREMNNKTEGGSEKAGFGTAGIWIKASYLNHSCVGNCRRSFIGDMQIVRATADMELGTELRFPYHSATEQESYDDVQRSLKHWGFSCDCALCQARQATPAELLKKRNSLFKRLNGVIKPGTAQLSKAIKLLEEMKGTYPAGYGDEVPRLEMYLPCFAMAMEYHHRGNFGKTAGMIVQGLQALGYQINAVWSHNTKARFDIQRWGMAHDMVPMALVNLHGASKSLAPSLSLRILEYAETAYSMVVGERETFKQTFPTAR